MIHLERVILTGYRAGCKRGSSFDSDKSALLVSRSGHFGPDYQGQAHVLSHL
jgi:hypothetical protein